MKTEQQKLWQKENIKRVYFELNKEIDKDILEWLDSRENKQKAIKDAIRKEIQNEQY